VTTPTLAGFAGTFLADARMNNKASSVKAKGVIMYRHLVPVFGASHLDGIGVGDVEAYKLARLADGLSKKSINNHLIVLNRILRLAHVLGHIGSARSFKLFRITPAGFDFLDFEEADRLVSACSDPWLRAIVVVALNTGMRIGELAALRWANVDLVSGRIMVRVNMWDGI
jgi:integrase